MPARQRIIPVRREYNRWVANQTLEDYALRFTAKSARKFSSSRISQTAIGAISFLALETQNVFWHSEESRTRLEQSLAAFSQSMSQLHAQYAASAA